MINPNLEYVEKIQPQNVKAEQAVLGNLLQFKESIFICREVITSDEFFYVPSHQQIFNAIINLSNKNQSVDIITVSEYLESKLILDDVGGYQYLSDLCNSIPPGSDVESYCKSLENSYQRRELIRISNEILKDAYDTTNDLSDTLDLSEKKILSVGEKRNSKGLIDIKATLSDRFNRYFKIFDGEKLEDETLVKTHLSALDEMLKIRNNHLIIIAGRPASGKTALALNLMTNISLKNDLPVAFFSLEMSKEQVIDRMLSAEAELSSYQLESGSLSPEDFNRLVESNARLFNSKIFVDDFQESKINEMRSKARKLKQKHGKLGAIFVDYLQLMEGDGSDQNRVNEVSKITRGLKKMARDLDCPVIALSQLSRKVEERSNKRPQLSDLRESGSVEQDSDSVLMIYRDEYYNPDTLDKNIAEIIIAKQRAGATGTVKLYFKPETTKFSSLEKF